MPQPRRHRRLRPTLGALLLVVAVLTGCSGDEAAPTDDLSPDKVLALAAEKITSTSGVHLTLATDNLPSGINGIESAEGIATNAPAFDGILSVIVAGTKVDVPVIAVDGVVHAQLPFTQGWNVVDPAEYGAPDPAGLIDADDGFPGLLGVTQDATKKGTVRGGTDNAEILTTYQGTVDGAAMARVIPSATGKQFAVQWQVTDAGELRKAVLTGIFYEDTPEMTYTVTLADYGSDKDITAP